MAHRLAGLGVFGVRSDVDIVLVNVDGQTSTSIEVALCTALGLEVDLLTFESLPPSFRERIEHEGLAIHQTPTRHDVCLSLRPRVGPRAARRRGRARAVLDEPGQCAPRRQNPHKSSARPEAVMPNTLLSLNSAASREGIGGK